MKKFIIFFCLSITTFFIALEYTSAQIDTAKKKVIYWLHGVGADEVPVWNLYDSSFTKDFSMSGVLLKYASDKKIGNIAQGVRLNIDTLQQSLLLDTSISTSLPVAIGHSMGGLVSRSIDQQRRLQNSSQIFRGIITVATPHRGSDFFEAIGNGQFRKLTTRFFSNISEGPLGIFALSSARKGFIARTVWDTPLRAPNRHFMSGDTASNFIGRSLGNIATYFFPKSYDPNVLQDMKPSSTFLEQLNNSTLEQDAVPTINIVAGHTKQPIYNMFSSLLHRPHLDALHNHDDAWLSKIIDGLASMYQATGEVIGCLNIFALFTQTTVQIDAVAENTDIAKEFIKGAKALTKDFPDGASRLTGSVIQKSEILGQRAIRETPSEDGIPVYRYETDEKIVFERILSDDGALSEIAQQNPNVTPDRIRVIRNVNHIGATNNFGTRLELSRTFTDARFEEFNLPLKKIQ